MKENNSFCETLKEKELELIKEYEEIEELIKNKEENEEVFPFLESDVWLNKLESNLDEIKHD